MNHVDLNCDAGESFGAYGLGSDAELLPSVTSVSIACGFHAGDAATMRATVSLAASHRVAIGAHPGLPDLQGFGRRAMEISPQEAYDLIVYQVGALLGFARAAGVPLQHVKPHGALYSMAGREPRLADAIARAVRDLDPGLVLFGLASSELVRAGQEAGLKTASEGFADRGYLADGSLVPRQRPEALITDAEEAARRAVTMVRDGRVATVQSGTVPLRVDTLCVHGDTPGAVELARRIREALLAEGITPRAIGRRDG